MEVQNRLRRVEQRLPEDVRRQGISVTEANSGFLLIVAIMSTSGETDPMEINNFANTPVLDELRRVHGVRNVHVIAPAYTMRITHDTQNIAYLHSVHAPRPRPVQARKSV